MKIISVKDYSALSRAAANIIAAQVILKPRCVLGLATGSSPVGTYQELVRRCQAGELDFSQVRTVNLDEYVGLDRDHDQSYAYFMRDNLFNHINLDLSNTNVPDGMDPDGDSACARYDQIIRDLGGIDLQLLGLGVNGHIGFNEPADAFSLGTHQVELTDSTRQANRRFFSSLEEVPTHARTMGTREILQARRVLMVGDNLLADIQGGIQAGLDTAWYNPGRLPGDPAIVPTWEVDGYAALQALILKEEKNNI